ncbi:hypothetical protein L3Q72_06080 [Vibrio sp. JC009]|uniref:hypothetical protein n=1 Tax=Vibrio sp. JC009 TaxID=2912314 RepID=UPI0023B1AA74|nr:hypothetical protein [Vibrio sp. JC009]WED22960.1 hypothetical protein L3Q72_06080 [Vibrio sp. JC009]
MRTKLVSIQEQHMYPIHLEGKPSSPVCIPTLEHGNAYRKGSFWIKTKLISIILLGLVAQGCNSTRVDTSQETEFTNFHRAEAKQLIDSGRYHQARTHLEILSAFDQSNAEIKSEIKLINVLIETKTSPLISKGHKELKKGQYRRAQKTLLAALAIDPENQQAFRLLRQASYIPRKHKQGEELVSTYSTSPPLTYEGFRRGSVVAKKPVAQPSQTTSVTATKEKPQAKPATVKVAKKPVAETKNKTIPVAKVVTKPKATPQPDMAKITDGYKVKPAVEAPKVVAKPIPAKPETSGDTIAMLAGKPAEQTIGPEQAIIAPETKAPIAQDPAPVSEPEPQVSEENFLAPFEAYYQKQQWSELIKAANYLPEGQTMPEQLKGWLFEAHLQKAQTLKSQNKLDSALGEASLALDYANNENKQKADTFMAEIREQLSQQLYAQGQKVFHSDIEKAISLWETALIYKENYPEVKHQLQKAYLIRKNLGNIKLNQ